MEPVVQQPWLGPSWTLAVGCTTLKGGRTDWLIEKATEIGAKAVIPLLTERSRSGGKNKFKTSRSEASGSSDEYQPEGRLERLAVAATKQCLRAHALELMPPQELQTLVPLIEASAVSMVACAGGESVRGVLDAAVADGGSWGDLHGLLLVGPEGDFTEEEYEMMMQAGARPVGLGPNRLRTETAALALLASACLYGP